MTRKKLFKTALILLITALIIGVFASVFIWGQNKAMQKLYPTDYADIVRQYAEEYALDEYLIFAVIKTESGFNPDAESSAAARGLMQLTEDTFNWIKSKIDPSSSLTFNDMYIPEHNIRFGSFFVAYCLDRFGYDVSTAAAAYHSGVGAVDALVQNPEYSSDGVKLDIFPDSVMAHYVTKINNSYSKYLDLYAEK